ncbi:uncharacterized protein DUF4271 [Arcticibacter tournemirensis]|uniref:DUF4271 domain-containing protein n=1 Tax=Arcticibacter tournemirensis TaxID=699437 RepID=A0A5M9H8G2_9SPHI|nr:DUF4271 domain-containing protein [Arcticibacter tournemirensis]KAA8481524.1 DUF4271 domain-containing protein [Arcticibacter tournemirensis]TQM49092.1 uncharacterized protein DUF4271 [Arcticibacter tournemirensis]
MPVKYLLLLLFTVFSGLTVFSQVDSQATRGATTVEAGSVARQPAYRDSASIARWMLRRDSIRYARDSIRAVADSLNLASVKIPDPKRPNLFRDSLVRYYMVKGVDFQGWSRRFTKLSKYEEGRLRAKGELWVVAFIFVLLMLFAVLRNAFNKELSAMIHAFFSNRVLGQINKEENFFNSWPFVFLYLLFGFTIGMFLYQCGKYFQLSYGYSGVSWFFRLSFIVIGLYTLKIIIIKILGFLFDAGKIVKEYISILFMSYFNLALLFLPIVIAFSLTPARFAPYYIYLSFILIGFIFFFQFLRAITNILSGYRFPKVYLFIYLCALEICPLLILIKALRF